MASLLRYGLESAATAVSAAFGAVINFIASGFERVLNYVIGRVNAITGCNIIPKKVEYFHDRVQSMPERTPQADDSLRQAARLAADRAAASERDALSTDATPEVIQPASDTAILTSAVSAQVGPPPGTGSSCSVAQVLLC